jgi:hypothetical protein
MPMSNGNNEKIEVSNTSTPERTRKTNPKPHGNGKTEQKPASHGNAGKNPQRKPQTARQRKNGNKNALRTATPERTRKENPKPQKAILRPTRQPGGCRGRGRHCTWTTENSSDTVARFKAGLHENAGTPQATTFSDSAKTTKHR